MRAALRASIAQKPTRLDADNAPERYQPEPSPAAPDPMDPIDFPVASSAVPSSVPESVGAPTSDSPKKEKRKRKHKHKDSSSDKK